MFLLALLLLRSVGSTELKYLGLYTEKLKWNKHFFKKVSHSCLKQITWNKFVIQFLLMFISVNLLTCLYQPIWPCLSSDECRHIQITWITFSCSTYFHIAYISNYHIFCVIWSMKVIELKGGFISKLVAQVGSQCAGLYLSFWFGGENWCYISFCAVFFVYKEYARSSNKPDVSVFRNPNLPL